MSASQTLRAGSVVTVLLGILLLLGTWDGLYSRLDLPHAVPALAAQIGGVGLLSLAFAQWSAASAPALRGPVSLAAAGFYLGSAAVLAAWLIFKDKVDLGVGDTGWAILIVTAVVFALLGGALARSARA
jgi:hypothetical protein